MPSARGGASRISTWLRPSSQMVPSFGRILPASTAANTQSASVQTAASRWSQCMTPPARRFVVCVLDSGASMRILSFCRAIG